VIRVVIGCVSICLYQQDLTMEKVQISGSPEFNIRRQNYITHYVQYFYSFAMNVTEICRHVEHS
jgi:hypothetical protein